MDLQEVEWAGMDYTDLAQKREGLAALKIRGIY
jgi:hypothetical protein